MIRNILIVAFGVSSILPTSAVSEPMPHGADLTSPAAPTTPASTNTPYEAPLQECDSGNVIPGSYLVVLNLEYSLEQHERTIGIDLSTVIDWKDSEGAFDAGGVYSATINNSTLTAVRKDEGVVVVYCNERVILMDPLDSESPTPVQGLPPSETLVARWPEDADYDQDGEGETDCGQPFKSSLTCFSGDDEGWTTRMT